MHPVKTFTVDFEGDIKPHTEWLTSASGEVRLCANYWLLPENKRSKSNSTRSQTSTAKPPTCLVFISHGFSEHLGFYGQLASDLVQQAGALVFGHDHVGHGRSGGERAHVVSFDVLVDDIVHHCQVMQAKYPSVPIYCIGHSMGGMLVVRTCILHPDLFAGVILQGALIIPGPSIGPFTAHVSYVRAIPVMVAVKLLTCIFGHDLVVGSNSLHRVTSDVEQKVRLASDPLRWHQGCKLSTLFAFVDTLDENWARLHKMTTPFLALHGTSDQLCNVRGSEALLKWSGAKDKRLVKLEGAAHQLYMERPCWRNEAMGRTIDWIRRRL